MSTLRTFSLLVAYLMTATAVQAWSQDLGSQPNDSAKTCEKALARANAAVARMPEGVEKLSAQKEVSAAKEDLASGNIISCNTHAKNAAGAAGTKTTH